MMDRTAVVKANGLFEETCVFRNLLIFMVLMTMGIGSAWGQDYSGVYYIGSTGWNANNPNSNYYLCPTEGWCYYKPTDDFDADGTTYPNPFLTTYQCMTSAYTAGADNAVWILEKHPTLDYYYIKHAIDGKYIVFNGQIRTTSNADRMRVHLESIETPNDNDNLLFKLIPNGTAFNIQSKGDTNNKYWTVNGGNKNSLKGESGKANGPTGYTNTAGIIGIYTSSTDANSKFYLEPASATQPTITNNFDGTFTISTETSGATIYYTTDGTTPTTSTTTTGTTSVTVSQTGNVTVIKAIAKRASDTFPSLVTTYNLPKCAKPVITVNRGNVTITCSTEGAVIHYTTDDTPATSTSQTYGGTFPQGDATTIRAIATCVGYLISNEATYLPPTEVHSSSEVTDMNGNYILADDFSSTGSIGTSGNPFSGTIDGNMITLTGLRYPLIAYAEDATIKNIILKDITISGDVGGANATMENVGAICNEAKGDCRIYNCGVLGTLTETKDANGMITNISSTSTISGSGYVGSIVGLLDGTSRVINCYSYATVGGGTTAAGIVGYNAQSSTQSDVKTMVVNCMFYGDITSGTAKYPVYGGNSINNDAENGINPYCYFRANATFDNKYDNIDAYNRSWPADEEYLTRFEYYRSILNSNRKLCTWWVNGTNGTAPADEDVEDIDIAKWVLDPAIAPYPILKKWGKYPSIINPDKTQTIDPRTIDDNGNTRTPTWTSRSSTNDYKGGILGTLSVTVNAGSNHAGLNPSTTTITLPITDMDTLNYDYGYYKVQLPYYNELFGDPTSIDHDTRYGGNYKAKVVTGWKITNITGGTPGTFTANWESGYNFADRNCTNKDLYSVSGRVFAQGGFFYVPEGVSAITIEAYWGKAVYLHNSGHYLDRVNITAESGDRKVGSPFAPAGKLVDTFQGQTVWDAWHTAVTNLDAATSSGEGDNQKLNLTVYDQAIVLLSNLQLKNGNGAVGYNIDRKWHPYTIMSIDQDLDNEPDYCFEFQMRSNFDRPGIQPIRFDFLPVPELGIAVRHNEQQNTIGIFVPQGHFEITETSFMHTTQFEYDAASSGTGSIGTKIPAPLILNGGHFEQIVARYGPQNKTQYFLMGGHFRMLRFTPGAHTNRKQTAKIRLCAVNAIGGEYPEFYLSGIYRPDIVPDNNQGNPHCYTNGGKFNLIAGAGYDKINGNITFKIDHSVIGEFYGGGINGANPVGGNIDVTIDHSLVAKYCGGPKVGTMASGKTVTTHATGTIFTRFYGGGNGGTSYYREQGYDGNDYALPTNLAGWTNIGVAQSCPANYNIFNPLNTITELSSAYDNTKGYHALYEFECFVESNGLGGKPTLRTYTHWAQFGTTKTGNITNNLNDCIIKENFYGGGNLGNVSGSVNSTLTDCTVYGSVFGGGFSGKIEPFRIHDKSSTVIPYTDKSGVMHDGTLDYVKDGVNDRYYTWSNASGHNTNSPTFQGEDGKWYVYTTESLEGLGAVSQNTSLTITTTEGGASTIGTDGDTTTGNVFGGGNESAVDGNTTVTLSGNVNVLGNVFGGGNKAVVGGSTDVKIE